MGQEDLRKCTIYIGNIPYDTEDKELRDLLQPREIRRVSIPVDPETKRCKGFAFVEFASEGDANSAVQAFDQTDFGGRTLKVSIARERTRSPSRGQRDARREREGRNGKGSDWQ